MRLQKIQIQNFRSFKDQTIELDDYTCLVGPNGCGKSTVLTALNIFFRNTSSTPTDVLTLCEEDFHKGNTADPIRITLTFTDLCRDAQEDLKHYYRRGELTVFAKAVWNAESSSAQVQQHGSRMVMRPFAPYFEAKDRGAKVPELAKVYRGIRMPFSGMSAGCSADEAVAALDSYRQSNAKLFDAKQGDTRLMADFDSLEQRLEAASDQARVVTICEELKEYQPFPDLPDTTVGTKMEPALRDYELQHAHLCELIDDVARFYGFTEGKDLLDKYIQWVYVPAVKDASGEQQEGSKTALGQILKRTIRTRVSFDQPLQKLRSQLEADYQQVIDQQQADLDELAESIESRLQEWTNSGASVSLKWAPDSAKSLVVGEPVARAEIGEDGFLGEVARLGHGIQRAFIVSLLEEEATYGAEQAPTLLLGFEEPELYQHPPQVRHLAELFTELAADSKRNTQIVVTTHSPYFAAGDCFEMVRMLRKHRSAKDTRVSSVKYEALADRMSNALGKKPASPTGLMARVHRIVQPTQRELLFCSLPIIVEGLEDVAFISAHLHLSARWTDFRSRGCHLVVAAGKTNMSRLVAICKELELPAYVVFDGDADDAHDDESRTRHERDNSCILTLCGLADPDPLPSDVFWWETGVMWPNNVRESVTSDVGSEAWNDAEQRARAVRGLTEHVNKKNPILIAATLELLAEGGIRSALLDKLCSKILAAGDRETV